ncbi:MAG: undecaprenyl-phosphate glucose phosphotransferase [Alphaproteobacteria bacterium]|nr:undecaprenyl-phosphate glucose phosphotransferase [Alphaproteobacteria bacterium]
MSASPAITNDQSAELALNATAPSKTSPKQVWSRKVAVDIVALLDATAIILGAFLPVTIYANFGGLDPNWILTLQSAIAASVVAFFILRSWGMYDPSRLNDFPEYPGRLFAGLIIALFAVIGLGLPFAIQDAHLWVWYAAWASASYTMLLGVRGISRLVLKKLTAAGHFDQRVAVYGAGQIARRVHDHLTSGQLGIHFNGVFDDRMGQDRVNPEGLLVAGRLDDLIEASRNEKIDQIIIALPQVAEGRIATIARQLERLPVSVHIVTHIASDLVENTNKHRVSNLGPIGMLDVKSKALSGWGPIVKRTEDIVLGTLLLIASAPLWPLIALAIKAESKGPALFRQRRRGLNKSEFEVLKFRTMTVMEDGDDVQQAEKNDPRITRVGAVLRRLSLDELPQLINVLKGEMSLVGPRPHAISHDDEFGDKIERYANRHQVKPGITGLAQVRGLRGPTDTEAKLEERLACDIEYISNWSLLQDLSLLARTFWVVLIGKNAY